MSEPSIVLDGVGKMYKLFSSRLDNFLDATALTWLAPWREIEYKEFWALRGIDLALGRGERIGIVGRNGAGKTTLLKLITENVAPTEGRVSVRGDVQALLEAGGGLHPEFTGLENITAALTHRGLTGRELATAKAWIADFTELGQFLEYPFRTYSAGMQARLAFAVATAVEPEILIVDEILGVGDAYFWTKSTGYMAELVESGASVILVSHALDQITRFCEQAIWLERGRIVETGPSLEVVKHYEQFIRRLEDRRLRGKARRTRRAGAESDLYAEQLLVRTTVRGPDRSRADISRIALCCGGEEEDGLDVGAPQDSDETQSATILGRDGRWSSPAGTAAEPYRSIEVEPTSEYAYGTVAFNLWEFREDAEYAATVTYRAAPTAEMIVEVIRDGRILVSAPMPADGSWRTEVVEIHHPGGDETPPTRRDDAVEEVRWPGSGSLDISRVRLLNADELECAVFEVGSSFTVSVDVTAQAAGRLPLIPTVLIFRLDGVVVTRHIGETSTVDVEPGDRIHAALALGELNLGNGHYVVSVGLYSHLDVDLVEPAKLYDYVDRSYEFQVVGNPRLHTELFRHPGTWTLEPVARDPATR